jgi:hypothetical protein
MKTHSEWIPECPLIQDGDRFTMLAAPVDCPYCRARLRMEDPKEAEQKEAVAHG